MDFQGFGWLGVCSPKPHIPEGSRGMGRGSRRAEGLRFVEHWQRTLLGGMEGSGLALLCTDHSLCLSKIYRCCSASGWILASHCTDISRRIKFQ